VHGSNKEFRSERVCLETVKYHGWAIQEVPDKFKTKELCLTAIKTLWRRVNEYKDDIPTDYWNDEEFCMEAVKQNFNALKYVPGKIKTKEFCLEAVTYAPNEMCIQYVPKQCRTEELCIIELMKTMEASKYVPEEIKKSIRRSVNCGLLPRP
jgi:hypothetical protein